MKPQDYDTAGVYTVTNSCLLLWTVM